MIETIFFIAVIALVWRRLRRLPSSGPLEVSKASAKLAQLSQYADRLYAEKKWVTAEKAYLDVLKLDHRNLTAYSHLGVIYTTQKQYADAIECFQIASQVRPSANTFQNLGLVFYENRNYIKSIAAFEKSIMFEPSASRYVGISKACRKLHDTSRVISSLEKAAELDPTPKILGLLADAYAEAGNTEAAAATMARLKPAAATIPRPARSNAKTKSTTILALKD